MSSSSSPNSRGVASSLDFQEAVRKIEERGDFNRYAEVKPVFEEQLQKLSRDSHTERALAYYYLLASYLKAQLVHETQEAIDFYEKMDDEFVSQEKLYQRQKEKHAGSSEMQDFYQLVERCYSALEFLYQRHNFTIRENLAYRQKMRFRKNAFAANGRFFSYLEYVLFGWTKQLRHQPTSLGSHYLCVHRDFRLGLLAH